MNGRMLERRTSKTLLAITALLAFAACGDASDPAPAASPVAEATETASQPDERSATADSSKGESTLRDPVQADDGALPLRLNVYSKAGYLSSDGTLIIDVMEGDVPAGDRLGAALAGIGALAAGPVGTRRR